MQKCYVIYLDKKQKNVYSNESVENLCLIGGNKCIEILDLPICMD